MRLFSLLFQIVTLWLTMAKANLEIWWMRTHVHLSITLGYWRLRFRLFIYWITGF